MRTTTPRGPGAAPPSAQGPDPKREAEIHSATRREHARETAQDYVETIAGLIAETGQARLVEVARRLGVSHVTANRTVARLRKAGYLSTQPYRAIQLTEKGRALAVECQGRHATVVAFLRSLGVSQEVAERDAEGIEHHVSPETLAAFERHLAPPAAHAPRRSRPGAAPGTSPTQPKTP